MFQRPENKGGPQAPASRVELRVALRALTVALSLAPSGCTPAGDGGDSTGTPDVSTSADRMAASSDRGLQADTGSDLGIRDLVSADRPSPDAGLPRLCVERPGAGARFIDASDAVGIGRAGLDLEGGRLSAADLDGDGYTDFIAHRGYRNERPAADAPAPYRVMMNRPGPGADRVFVDETERSGYDLDAVGRVGRVAHFALFGDLDNDGDTDVIGGVNTDNELDSGDRTVVLLNVGGGVLEHAPLSDVYPGRGVVLATTGGTLLDANLDGDLDLFLGHGFAQFGDLSQTQQDLFYTGNGNGTFRNRTQLAGLTTQSPVVNGALNFDALNQGKAHKPTYGVAACDLDGDGDGDLMTVSYGRQWNMLWVNGGDGTFTDQSVSSGFNMDGNTDFSDNEFYRCHCQTTGRCEAPAPRIQCNGNLWNVGIDDQPFRLGGNTFALTCADINDDGRADVLTGAIKHWHIGDSSDTSTVLMNTGSPDEPTFERPGNEALGLERSWMTPSWNEGDIFSAIFDFDLDGRKDLYWGSTDYPETHAFLFRQKEDGSFDDVSSIAGLDHARAAGFSLLDVEKDGDLDVLVGSSTMRCSAADDPPCPWTMSGNDVYLYRNDASERHNWLAIDLDALDPVAAETSGLPACNRAGVGAKVVVTAGGRKQYYEVSSGHGHFVQQDERTLHIGLGETCDVESVEVVWPDRTHTQTLHSGMRANTFVRLSRDGSTLETHVPAVASP